jgi:hypothetical protein
MAFQSQQKLQAKSIIKRIFLTPEPSGLLVCVCIFNIYVHMDNLIALSATTST